TLTVTPDRAVSFPLLLRVPAWAEGATAQVAGEGPVPMKSGSFHRVEREWRERTAVNLRFPLKPRVTRRYNEALAVERGPLVYSLSPEESWTRVNADEPHRELPHGDFEVRPASAWNYGLLLDPERPEAGLTFEERPVGESPFSPEGAGMAATAQGRRLPRWKLAHGWAGEIAPGLHSSPEPREPLTLLPYGCTNIRVTEFPRLKS
ncbi:MAG: beta-L-arabinofuranosidase domain-containing protein, partial [Planctomycetota bacterium]